MVVGKFILFPGKGRGEINIFLINLLINNLIISLCRNDRSSSSSRGVHFIPFNISSSATQLFELTN